MKVLDAVLSKWREIKGIWLSSASFTLRHINFLRSLESLNIMHSRGWHFQTLSYLSLRNIVFKHFSDFLRLWGQIFIPLCSCRIRPFLDAAFVPNHNCNHLLASAVSNHIIIQIFYLITSPKLPPPQLSLECVAGLNGKTGCLCITRQNNKYLIFIWSAMTYKSKWTWNSMLPVYMCIFHTVITSSKLGLYIFCLF